MIIIMMTAAKNGYSNNHTGYAIVWFNKSSSNNNKQISIMIQIFIQILSYRKKNIFEKYYFGEPFFNKFFTINAILWPIKSILHILAKFWQLTYCQNGNIGHKLKPPRRYFYNIFLPIKFKITPLVSRTKGLKLSLTALIVIQNAVGNFCHVTIPISPIIPIFHFSVSRSD